MARRIGVEVTTETRGGPTNPGGPAGLFQIAGVTERGPVGPPVAVRSLAEYIRQLGERTPYSGAAYDAARTFFSEGGNNLLVTRVVGPNAAAAGVDLLSPEVEGAPGDPVLRVEAAEVGGYANDYTVTVTRANDAYTLTVTDHDGEPLLTVRNATEADQITEAAGRNRHVNITTLDVQETLNLEPGDYALTGGSDDREAVGSAEVIDALNAGGKQGEGTVVAVPGYPADVVGEALINHASENRKVALLAADRDATRAELESLAAQLQADTPGKYGALFAGSVRISDGSGSRVVSPEGFVAALRARQFATGRFWSVPAGTDKGRARWVTGTEPTLSRSQVEELDEVFVNGIQTSGSRVYLNNWTSLARDREAFPLVRDADVLNNLAVQLEQALEGFVWEDIDSRGLLHSDVDSAVTGIMARIAALGGAWAATDEDGEEIDPGYVVNVNPDPALAADNRVEVEVGIRLPGAAKLISVGIIKVAIGGDL